MSSLSPRGPCCVAACVGTGLLALAPPARAGGWTRAQGGAYVLSHSLAPWRPAYVTLDAGYNQRTRGFTSQDAYGVEVGYQVQKAWLTAGARTLASVRAPRPDRLASLGLSEGVVYSSYSLGVNYTVTKYWWAPANLAGGATCTRGRS